MREISNSLLYGDNLPVMRERIDDESVDLVYLDPPFNSDLNYNVLFKADGLHSDEAQVTAFKDTWTWDAAAQTAFDELQSVRNPTLVSFVNALDGALARSPMLAYLVNMAPRIVEIHRVLKPTGSAYLHCDPTASHYLKMLMDAVFWPANFRSEIVWRRTGSHNKARRWAPIHDVILFYTKSNDYTWTNPRRPYMLGHVKDNFVEEHDGVYKTNYYGNVLTGSGTRGGESGKPWRGFDPTAKGRHWAVPGKIWDEAGIDPAGLTQHEKLDLLFERGFITIADGEAWPMYERTITANDGPAAPDIWAYQPYTEGTVFGTEFGIDADVRWLSPQDAERLGYPTQKPLGILKHILNASSRPGDLVLDPFCGCGTTIEAAQILARRWIGIDISPFAIELIRRQRLEGAFPHLRAGVDYKIEGLPTTVDGARMMAEQDKDRKAFEIWAVSKVDGIPNDKKGADKGIDGRIPFRPDGKTTKFAVVSVKSGKLKADDVRALASVAKREEASSLGFGVLVVLNAPTAGMKADAASAGTVEMHGNRYPLVQILTIEAILKGKKPHLPLVDPSVGYGKRASPANIQGSLL
ncbi:MAG TPA: DNA methyltransferase [Terracidiphilus sp.]|nr:DNA methyltransferase [Terracidiphilus sp.]